MTTAVILTAVLAAITFVLLTEDKEEEDYSPTNEITLNIGSIEDSELIYENIHTRTARNSIKREDTLQIETVEKDDIISAIIVELLEGEARSFVQKGGIGQKTVELVLRSKWNKGYRFRVRVFGKKISEQKPKQSQKSFQNKMAPVKFGLFRARSRDHQEQPSTENLLQSSASLDMDQEPTPDSPLPSTSKGLTQDAEPPDMTSLHLDSEDEDEGSAEKPVRRHSECSGVEEPQVNYNQLRNQTSTDATSTSTLNDNDVYANDDDASTSCDVNSLQFEMPDDISMAPSEDLSVHCGTMRRLKKNRSKEERLLRDYDMWRASNVEVMKVNYNQLRNQTSTDATSTSTLNDNDVYANDDDASTSCDVNSLQFEMPDDISMAPSEDLSVHCGTMRRLKKNRSKEERLLRDYDMWRASNVEVMKNLLSRSGTHDDQIKWEAIANARGLCTLTDSCTCGDCTGAKYLAAMADGDGGLGAAPLLSAISVGCVLQ